MKGETGSGSLLRLCFIGILETEPMKSHQHECQDNNRHGKVDRKTITRPQDYTKSYSQKREAERVRNCCPKGRVYQFFM